MNLVDALEYKSYFFCGEELSFEERFFSTEPRLKCGQYAEVWSDGSTVWLARDGLGIYKLFYAQQEGVVFVANRIQRLLDYGINLRNINSVPAGHILKISSGAIVSTKIADLLSITSGADFDLVEHQSTVDKLMKRYFSLLSRRRKGHKFAVCLSGGLDSSIIATYAKRYLENVTFFSFSFADNEILEHYAIAGKISREHLQALSLDFQAASKISNLLDVKLVPVLRSRENVLPVIRTVVALCQDWRDFNVHCAVVNYFLAQDIRTFFPAQEITVLTGDLMNEFVCDYHEESVGTTIYYPQPRINIEQRRRFYIRGLDAGDREVGIFNALGLSLLQPYSVVADMYMKIPTEHIADVGAKQRLNSFMLDPRIRDFVAHAKRRAQVGDEQGGVLGVFHNMGVTGRELLKTWKNSLSGSDLEDKEVESLIQFGRYRTGL